MADKITISDVAKKAGVSPATVSRIINKKSDGSIKISPATREKVLKVASELGYRINPYASALRSNQTGLIGAVVRDIGDPFLNKMIKELQKQFQTRKHELFIGHSAYKESVTENQLSMMINHWFDGLIILTAPDKQFIDEIHKSQIPYIFIYGSLLEMYKPTVQTDDREGVKEAIQYLKDLKHEKIAFIGKKGTGTRQRTKFFREILDNNLLKEEWVTEITDETEIKSFIQQTMEKDEKPTALFCCTDRIAMKAIYACNELNIKIPDELSIMGFDDIDSANDIFPRLTTIRQPYEQIAKATLNYLFQRINEDENPIEDSVILKPTLVIRDSCRER